MMLGYPYGWITAVSLFFLLTLIIIFASPVIIKAYFRRIGSNDIAEMKVKALYGLVRFRMKVPQIEFNGTALEMKEQVSNSKAGINTWKQYQEEIDADKVAGWIDKYKHVLQITRNLKGLLRETLSKVRLVEWNWSTKVGTGDAMWTAMATGAMWSVQTSILGVLSQVVKLKAVPKMNVEPEYKQPAFSTELTCMAQIRLGYALIAGIRLLLRLKKLKGGVKAWRNLLSKA